MAGAVRHRCDFVEFAVEDGCLESTKDELVIHKDGLRTDWELDVPRLVGLRAEGNCESFGTGLDAAFFASQAVEPRKY